MKSLSFHYSPQGSSDNPSNGSGRPGPGLAVLVLLFLVIASVQSGRGSDGGHAEDSRSRNLETGLPSDDVVPGVVVVKFKRSSPDAGGPAVQSAAPGLHVLTQYGVTSLERAFPMAVPLPEADVASGKVDLSRIHVAAIPASMNPVEVAAQLAALPEVEYAEPTYNYYLATVPNDSDYVPRQQVYFDRMQVAAGWTLQKGGADVVIAAVDGGTNWEHPDLAQNIWVNSPEDINHDGVFTQRPPPDGDINGVDDDGNGYIDDVIGWNFGTSANNPRGFLPINADHGTQTASIFGAVTNNGTGMAGTSWNCRLMPLCVSHRTTDNSVPYGFQAIEYAFRMGARVINCSWYRAGGSGNHSQFEQDVITAATQAGCLVVAAAGNNHLQNLDERPYYPASYDHVLSVGATADTSDALAYFTNYGLNVTTYAPGMRIYVARDDGSYGSDQGTSDATPLVAGLAALLFAAHPDWTPEQVAAQIRMTSDPIDASNPSYAGSLAHGRVNFVLALSETHAGVVAKGETLRHFSGRKLFFEGDTLEFSATVENVLPLAAENLSFTLTSDASLEAVSPVLGPTRLAPGAKDSVACTFVVNRVQQKQVGKVRLAWNTNGNDQDARMFTVPVYPRNGYWERQRSPTGIPLWDVHAASSRVAWATGFASGNPYSIVLRTVDGGENWVHATGDLPRAATACIFALDSLRAWVGGFPGIFATTDGGVSWKQQDYPQPHSTWINDVWFFDPANGYAWGDASGSIPGRITILRTSDGGKTWSHIPNEPVGPADAFGWSSTLCCPDPQHIFFVVWFEGQTRSSVVRSTDGGSTWSSIEGNGSIHALAMRDDSVGILCSGNLKTPQPAYFGRTTDGGTAWQQVADALPEKGAMAAFPAGSTFAWLAGVHTVAHSTDEGMSWVEQPIDRIASSLSAISFSDPAHGWIVTAGGGIFRYRPVSTEVVPTVQPNEALPSRAMLQQNYPNPFNSKTVVSSQYPVVSEVKLVVYDLLGREVAVLVNERRAPGLYRDTFDGSGLASGVYFYRLQSGSFVDTKKLLLVR